MKKKNNIKKNKKHDAMKPAIANAVLVAVLTVLLGAGVTLYINHESNSKRVEQSAATLYTDIANSLSLISSSLKAINSELYHDYIDGKKREKYPDSIRKIQRTPFSKASDNYSIYLNDLKDELSGQDYKNVVTHFQNIETLEKMRNDYLEDYDKNSAINAKRAELFKVYYQELYFIHSLYFKNVQGAGDTLDRLQILSKLPEINYIK